MFGWWRRKNDGFVWHEHVRTTIQLRRDERARKIEEIKQAAAAGAMEAGRQGVSAGRNGLGALWSGLVQSAHWFWDIVVAVADGIGQLAWRTLSALGEAGAQLGTIRPPGWNKTRRSGDSDGQRVSSKMKIALMFLALGALAGLSAILQYRQSGLDWSAGLAAIVSVVLLGLAMTPWLRQWLAGLSSVRRPDFGRFSELPALTWVGAVAGIIVFAAAGYWIWQNGVIGRTTTSIVSSLPSMPAVPSFGLGSAQPDVEGDATAITGDTLRIDSKLIQLAGIEAPELSQICRDRRRRAWRCGTRARNALRRLVRRKQVVCTEVRPKDSGRYSAKCKAGEDDLALAIVKLGYAFADGSGDGTYKDAENVIREAKRGIWQGTVQKPAEFRAERWERASKSAPDGCPIKGRIVRKAKVYVLPWALDYRQVRVRADRGERWFCSESDAMSAGFRPSSTG